MILESRPAATVNSRLTAMPHADLTDLKEAEVSVLPLPSEGPTIPRLDASRFHAGPAARKAYTEDLLDSFQKHGFVRLINHSVPNEMVEHVFKVADLFFQLDQEEKLVCENKRDGKPQRGYSAVGIEKTSTLFAKLVGSDIRKDLKDAREHFDCGSPNDKIFPNRWPSDMSFSGFRTFMESYYAVLEQCSQDILEALEEALSLPAYTFRGRVTTARAASELRLNHYPPVALSTLRSGMVSRIWPHFDLGVITLLFTSGVGGLEIEDRAQPGANAFIPVRTDSRYELVVNISETMQRWTNDVVPAGLHRVNLPHDMAHLEEGIVPRRFSVAYLCKADQDAPVGTIGAFKTPAKPGYEDMTALEYHQMRLAAAY